MWSHLADSNSTHCAPLDSTKCSTGEYWTVLDIALKWNSALFCTDMEMIQPPVRVPATSFSGGFLRWWWARRVLKTWNLWQLCTDFTSGLKHVIVAYGRCWKHEITDIWCVDVRLCSLYLCGAQMKYLKKKKYVCCSKLGYINAHAACRWKS